jgi:hypothetical protein
MQIELSERPVDLWTSYLVFLKGPAAPFGQRPYHALPSWGLGSQEKMAAPRSLNTLQRILLRFNAESPAGD